MPSRLLIDVFELIPERSSAMPIQSLEKPNIWSQLCGANITVY